MHFLDKWLTFRWMSLDNGRSSLKDLQVRVKRGKKGECSLEGGLSFKPATSKSLHMRNLTFRRGAISCLGKLPNLPHTETLNISGVASLLVTETFVGQFLQRYGLILTCSLLKWHQFDVLMVNNKTFSPLMSFFFSGGRQPRKLHPTSEPDTLYDSPGPREHLSHYICLFHQIRPQSLGKYAPGHQAHVCLTLILLAVQRVTSTICIRIVNDREERVWPFPAVWGRSWKKKLWI